MRILPFIYPDSSEAKIHLNLWTKHLRLQALILDLLDCCHLYAIFEVSLKFDYRYTVIAIWFKLIAAFLLFFSNWYRYWWWANTRQKSEAILHNYLKEVPAQQFIHCLYQFDTFGDYLCIIASVLVDFGIPFLEKKKKNSTDGHFPLTNTDSPAWKNVWPINDWLIFCFRPQWSPIGAIPNNKTNEYVGKAVLNLKKKGSVADNPLSHSFHRTDVMRFFFSTYFVAWNSRMYTCIQEQPLKNILCHP